MNLADVAVLSLVGLLLVASIRYMLREHRAGRCIGCSGGCGEGGCAGCSGGSCGSCGCQSTPRGLE